MNRLEIDEASAEQIAVEAIRYANKSAGINVDELALFRAQPAAVRLQMLAGVHGVVQALQSLGYRISPPLKSISNGDTND